MALSSRFFLLLSVILCVLISISQARTIYVDPTSTAVAPRCGGLDNACRSLKAAFKICDDGDIISLSVGIHEVEVSLVLNKNIALTIQGKGKTLTAIKLARGVRIDLFQVNLDLLDLTVSGGIGISVNAMARVLGLVDLSVHVDINVNIRRVQFLNNRQGLILYAPDPDLLGVFGSINANVEACIFIGGLDVAVTVGTKVDVTFSRCKWLNNKNGALQVGGATKNNQCPLVRLDACIFRGNVAKASLIIGGTSNCDDLLVFVGINVFDTNVAVVLLGFLTLDVSLGWNYQCDDCDLRLRGNEVQSNCGAFCEKKRCDPPPAFPGVDVDICVGGLGIGLTLPISLPLPLIPNLPDILPPVLPDLGL